MKMFEENKGEISCMRVMSFLSLVFAACITFYGLYKGIEMSQLTMIIASFIGGAFGGKLGQKYFELGGKIGIGGRGGTGGQGSKGGGTGGRGGAGGNL